MDQTSRDVLARVLRGLGRPRVLGALLLSVVAAVLGVQQAGSSAAVGGAPWALLLTGVSVLGLLVVTWLSWRAGAATTEIRPPWSEVQEVFARVVEAEPETRETALNRITDDPAVQAEVRELLRAHERTGVLDRLAGSLGSAVTAPEPGFPELGTQVGQYALVRRLGAGGMGVVYEARDTRLERTVALKFLAPAFGADPTAKQRFLAEARAAAALDHPNVCTILEIGDVADQLFIAMPYYRGRTVKEILAGGPVGLDTAVSISIQVGRGLAAAHAAGIVHRDVKPANIIVTEDGTVTIVDFGVAKVARQSLTRTGIALGTVSYMSPEQARGDPVDQRTDIWSLGVVLYEMVAGTRPFPGPSEPAVRTAILTTEPRPLAAFVDAADGLERIAMRALQKDPAARYAMAGEMVQALEQVQRGFPSGQSVAVPAGGVMRRGERRHVTVLTTVIGEYDSLVDHLPPETSEALLLQVRQTVGDAVRAEGGMVHATDADRIESVFGLPAAREDDATRAIRAALDVRDRLDALQEGSAASGLRFSARSGIDLGVVAVHQDPEEQRRYRIGRTLMERASRLARQAAPREVLLSAECARMVRSFVETEEGPEVALGHDSGTVTAYRAVDLREYRSSLEARASGGLTAFTGRSAEIALLEESLEDALSGAGRIVTVSGEAGIGKSRLLYEFEHGVLRGRTRVLRGRCQSYGASAPYLPFLDVLRELLSGEDGEPPTSAGIGDRLRALGDGLEDYAPFYCHLLSLPSAEPVPAHLSGDQLRLAIVESLAAVLTVASTATPSTLLLEDWHWADEASTAALTQLGGLISAFPMLVVVTHRPGYGVTWDIGNRRAVALGALPEDGSRQVIRSALRVEEVDEDLTRRIHQRSQGNPFFIEEVCAALLEQGTISLREDRAALSGSSEELTLPDSVQAVIRTRLDRMAPATREVLSAASVVGRDFTRTLVARALPEASDLGAALDRLRSAGLIQQTRLVPDATFRFKHALIQEVTYEALLGHQRLDLHRRVGEAMEAAEVGADADPPYERLADHFFRAEVWDKAVDYSLGAARRASRLSQIPQAMRALQLSERALAHLSEEDAFEHRLDLLLMRERLCETTGERREQRRIIEELLPLVRGSGDTALEAEVLVRAGDLEVSLRNHDAAEPVLKAAVAKSREVGDPALYRKALRSFGLLRWHQDRNDEALEILQTVLESDMEAGDTEGVILDHHNLGSVHRGMGDIPRALKLAEESVRLAAKSPFRQVYAIHTVALCQRDLGDAEKAEETWRKGIDLCEQHHLPLQQSYLMTSLAHLYLQMGRTGDSLARYEEAVALARQVRHAEGAARAVSALAGVLEGLGRPEEALPYWREAATWFARMEEASRRAHAQCRVASIEERLGRDARGLAAWGVANQLAAEAGDTELEIESLEALGRLTRRHLGASALSLPYYERALELATQSGDLARQGSLLNSMGVMAWEAGDDETARARYAAAAECFRELGDPAGLGLTLNSLGQTLRRMGALHDARETLERAIAVNREVDNGTMEGYGLAALGDTLLAQGEDALAAIAYQDSLVVRRRHGDRVGEGWMLQRLAALAHSQGHLGRVRELLTDATRIADELGDGALLDACARLRR